MAALSRLSPYNIDDDLRRVALYREIRDGQSNREWLAYEIQPADILRPELIAYKVYGNAELKWLVLIAAGLDDMRERLAAGTLLRLPSPAWIRQKIKQYVALEEALDG
jgi:hypothetical protein